MTSGLMFPSTLQLRQAEVEAKADGMGPIRPGVGLSGVRLGQSGQQGSGVVMSKTGNDLFALFHMGFSTLRNNRIIHPHKLPYLSATHLRSSPVWSASLLGSSSSQISLAAMTKDSPAVKPG